MNPRYARRLSSIELHQLYVVDGLRCPAIAKTVGADPSTVRLWLLRAGIPTIRRGHNPEVHFKRGERSKFAGRKHKPESIALVKASTVRDGRVPYLKNGVHWLKGKSAEENPNYKGGITPERQEFYRSAEWKAACVIVWQRADAKCERCGIDHRKIDRKKNKFHVHHVISFRVKDMRATPSNLVLLCQPCHMFVHSRRNIDRAYLAPMTAANEGQAA